MKPSGSSAVRIALFGIAACGLLGLSAQAQTPGPDKAAAHAIEVRQAVYTLVGNNFGPLAAMMQGKMPYNGDEALKRAERVAFLAGMAPEVFPDISRNGDTKAKPEIWENRAEFDKHMKGFGDSANALVAQLRSDKNNADAFKAATMKLAGECKGCHDDFRAK